MHSGDGGAAVDKSSAEPAPTVHEGAVVIQDDRMPEGRRIDTRCVLRHLSQRRTLTAEPAVLVQSSPSGPSLDVVKRYLEDREVGRSRTQVLGVPNVSLAIANIAVRLPPPRESGGRRGLGWSCEFRRWARRLHEPMNRFHGHAVAVDRKTDTIEVPERAAQGGSSALGNQTSGDGLEPSAVAYDEHPALRHWEREGLIEASRGSNGYRRYSQAQLQRLQLIVLLRAGGYSIAEIHDVLDGMASQDPAAAVAAARRHLEEINESSVRCASATAALMRRFEESKRRVRDVATAFEEVDDGLAVVTSADEIS